MPQHLVQVPTYSASSAEYNQQMVIADDINEEANYRMPNGNEYSSFLAYLNDSSSLPMEATYVSNEPSQEQQFVVEFPNFSDSDRSLDQH